MVLGSGFYGMYMMCCGYFLLFENLPIYWRWAYYLGFHTYAFRSAMYIQFNDFTVSCGEDEICRFRSGKDVLEWYDMEDVNVGTDMLILVGMALGYRLIFYALLVFVHNGRK